MDDADRNEFLRTLGEACAKMGWQVHAYCSHGHRHRDSHCDDPAVADPDTDGHANRNGHGDPDRAVSATDSNGDCDDPAVSEHDLELRRSYGGHQFRVEQ